MNPPTTKDHPVTEPLLPFVEREPRQILAVQLSTKNIDEIIAWIKRDGMHASRYAYDADSIVIPNPHGEGRVAKQGDWLLPKGDGFVVLSDEVFTERFRAA